MEAVRARLAATDAHEVDGHPSTVVDSHSTPLPPPPEPFPLHELPQRYGIHDPVLGQQLSDLQASCIGTLTCLLPTDSPSTSPAALHEDDRPLAAALTELLEATYELDHFHPSPAYEEDPVAASSTASGLGPRNAEPTSVGTSLAALTRHLSGLDAERASNGTSWEPALTVARGEIAWERVKALSRAVGGMLEARSIQGSSSVEGHSQPEMSERQASGHSLHVTRQLPTLEPQPPRYVPANGHAPEENLPDYHEAFPAHAGLVEVGKVEAGPSSPQSRSRSTSSQVREEKMLLDLDNLTSTIERLTSTSPAYLTQRSTLRPTSNRPKSSPILLVRESHTNGTSADRKMTERQKMAELEEIWRRIERAHGKQRMRDDQRVELGGLEGRKAAQRERFLQELYDKAEMSRMRNQEGVMRDGVNRDLAKARELRDKDRFLRELIEQSASARMSDQDAIAPDASVSEEALREKQRKFIQDVIARMESGRLGSQDYTCPQTANTTHDAFIDSILSYTASGRLSGQDSEPPTPRRIPNGDASELVTMQDFFRSAQGLDDTTGEGEKTVAGECRTRTISAASEDGDGKRGGTFRKIKGMVRRSSLGLGLGLKSPTETNLALANFVAEYQENLNIVTVLIHGLGTAVPSDLTLRSLDPAACSLPAVEAVVEKGSTVLKIPVPAVIYSHQSTSLAVKDSYLEGKLAAVSKTTSTVPTLLSSFSHPLSARELLDLRPSALCCQVCDREVASIRYDLNGTVGGYSNAGIRPDPFHDSQEVSGSRTGIVTAEATFKDLPSEHWAEMMEVWMCHQDPSFTARLAQRTRDGFWPVKNQVLVGGSYLMVHGENVRKANVNIGPSKEVGWTSVMCACGETLGKAREEDGKIGAGTVRFAKWAIALLREDEVEGENVEPLRYPLDIYITADMLGLAQAHATYRFNILDENSGEKKIFIWLFNPSIRLTYRRSAPPLPSPHRNTFNTPTPDRRKDEVRASTKSRRSSVASQASLSASARARPGGPTAPALSNGETERTLRACKIMYRIALPGEVVEMPGFAADQAQVEDLRYPAAVVARLAQALRDSSAVYPDASRRMGMWDIGFLERH